MTRNRKTVIALSAVALLLIAACVAMPYIVEDYANEKLASLDSYDGQVGDIDIHLWRGAYSIDDIEIDPNKEPKDKKGESKESEKKVDSARRPTGPAGKT